MRWVPCLAGLVVLAACAAPRGACRRPTDPLPGIDQPYKTPEEVVAAFDALECAFVKRHDGRGAFHTTYRLVTHAALDRIGRGYFEDDAYIAHAVVVFANYYREALLNYELGVRAAVPKIWCIAFDAAVGGRVSLHQCVLLGVAAHIRDLAYTVADLGTEPRDARHRDYTAVNEVLWNATDCIQRRLCRLYEPGFCVSDRAFLFLDEGFANGWLENIREDAWRKAVRLERAPSAVARSRVEQEIRRTSLTRARRILSLPLPRR